MLPILKSDFWRPVRRRYSPVDSVFGDMERWLPRLFDEGWREELAFEPRLDVTESEKAITVRAEIPGIDPKDIHIEVQDGVLSISGEKKAEETKEEKGYHWTERHYGSFARSIRVPDYVESDKIDAGYKDGVLSIELPKTEKAKPKQIEVKAG